MKLTFLGSGSAFTVGSDNYHSNMLLEDEHGERLLIDCGADIRFSLHAVGKSLTDINHVYISHLHSDHAGGLEALGFINMFQNNNTKPHLYIGEALVDKLWHNVLSGGMSSLQGKITTLDTFFKVNGIAKNQGFVWNNVQFQLVQTVHTMSGFTIIPSYGLFFKVNDTTIFITTDTQFTPNTLINFYKKADIIFHDCETSATPSGVHSHYNELKTLDKEIKAKMWLYHFNPGKLPAAKKEGFKGFVRRGQVFNF